MKKIFFLILIAHYAMKSLAQEPADALRYSWYSSSGSARQQAIGGAMASLGGDISATFVNPAGLAFYKTSDFVFSPGFNFLNNKSTYFSRTEKDNKQHLAFGTTGVVIGSGTNNRKNGPTSNVVSLAINQTANFGSNILYRGSNNQSSYSQKFLEEIKNNNDKDANHVAAGYPSGTSLAFNTYWIDTIAGGSSGNYQFQTRAPIATGLLQENAINNTGGITELALGFASSYRDKIFAGLTIGVPFLHYHREATFNEADATANLNNKFDFASITENLTTNGIGFNLKAGIIFKPTDFIRLGFAIHSPTLFNLTDHYNASITANTESYKSTLTQSTGDVTGGQDVSFKYLLLTPYRLIASASYVLREVEDVRKQKGFLTLDVEYLNYTSSSFKPDYEDHDQANKDYLKSLNKAIDKAYKGAFNIKAGGELKFTTVMVRLGTAYYSNPYKNLAGEKGSRFQLSGGLGYRNKGFFVDVAYVYIMGKDVHFPYRLQYSPFSNAKINATGGNAILTVGFKI